MLSSTATVTTDTPARYAKQLVSHLGHKAEVSELPDGSHELQLSAGVGVVRVVEEALVMEARAADQESLAAVESVLARHLVRFGARSELEVVWSAPHPTDAEQSGEGGRSAEVGQG